MAGDLGFDLSPEQEVVLSKDLKHLWGTLQTRQRISPDSFDMLNDMDQAPAADQSAHFDDEREGLVVARMFCELLEAVRPSASSDSLDGLRYVSLWLRVLLTQKHERGRFFFQEAAPIKGEPLRVFVTLLYDDLDKDYAREILGNLIVSVGIIVSNEPDYNGNDKHLGGVTKWLESSLKKLSKVHSKNDHFGESLTIGLKGCLKNKRIMELVLDDQGAFANQMHEFISNQSNIQVQYYAGFALLLIALKDGLKENIAQHANLCKTMISLISSAKKEKVQRIYLSVIERLADINLFSEMCVMYGLFPLLERLSETNFKDEDLKELVTVVADKLRPYIRVMSSMERYKKELSTKTLEWGPVHTEKFWKKNFINFEANEFLLVKDLCGLLDSQDETTVCVAAHDLGEFARLYPDGRRLVSLFGAKTKLFVLLEESISDEVKKQCLLATQKLLVQNWQKIE